MTYINNIEKAKIFKSKEIIDIYSSQIVSSKLADNDSFNLEVYSFDVGEKISNQKAIYDTLYFVVKGNLKIADEIIKEEEYKIVNKGEGVGLIANAPSLVFVYSFKVGKLLRNLNNKINKKLSQEVAFVKNSVTSKILFQSDILSLTLLSLDEGQGLNSHSASGDALVISLEGEVLIKIDQDEYNLSETDSIILPVGIPHSLLAKKPYKMFLTVVKQ